jgi:hypothetical protein
VFRIDDREVGARSCVAGTRLGSLAAALTPGGWTPDIASPSMNESISGMRVYEGSDGSGSFKVMWDWGSKGVYDSVDRRIYILGAPAGTGTHANSTVLSQFDESSDTWSRLENPIGVAAGHAYDNFDLDGPGRRLFKQSFQQSQGQVFVRNLNSGEVTNLGNAGTSYSVCGLAWFPTLGSMGSLIVCGNGAIRRYDFASARWTTVRSAVLGDGAFAHYNPVSNVVICGGGQSGDARFYRIRATGAVDDIGIPPIQMSIYEGGSHALLVPHPGTSASLAFCSDGTIRSLNHDTGGWGSAGQIPAIVRNPDATMLNNTIACTISEYGVIALMQNRSLSRLGLMFLYKP